MHLTQIHGLSQPSRTVWPLSTQPYGLGSPFIRFAALALILLTAGRAALALGLAACAATAVAWLAKRLIGGITGDVLGAVEQIAEAALLLGASAG